MEILLLSAVVISFIAHVLILRYFVKRLSDKISHLINTDQNTYTGAIPGAGAAKAQFNVVDKPENTRAYRTPTAPSFDLPATNEASAEEANDIELNEQNLTNLPSDVKFTVEGGDTNVPPGFEERK